MTSSNRSPARDDLVFVLASRGADARALPRRLAVELFEATHPAHHASGLALADVAALGAALGGSLVDDAASLRDRVVRALLDGRVVALREGRGPRRAAAVAPEAPPEEAPLAPAAPRETKTWITLRLIDDADPPWPVARARYRIKLPDGTVREGRLDAMGTAHLEDLDPGTCEVSFPDYDRGAWARV